MNTSMKFALAACTALLGAQAMAQITLYPGEGWRGRPLSLSNSVSDMRRMGFDDRASSIVVEGGRWQICEHPNFQGECRILRPGSYESLQGMGLNNSISSIRALPRRRQYDMAYAPEPLPQPTYEYRVRPHERVFEAPVTSVRAVVGPPEQRCWMEREQVVQGSNNGAVGAVAGAVLGGVLGHQVGGGSGRDLATVGGALVGAAAGANVARRDGSNQYAQEVQRCRSVASTTPQYWDVTYEFRGVQHRAQMTQAPGRYVTVNRDGEPRM